MKNTQPYRIKTISEFHELRGLPKPEHPLISALNLEFIKHVKFDESIPTSLVFDFYSISLKKNFPLKIKYGQQQYDFDEGVLSFMSPGQVFGIETNVNPEDFNIASFNPSGWMLLIHPDFLWNTALAKTIKNFEFFDYSVNEALFLSEKEETTLIAIMKNIENEYKSNIDKFSQNIIIAQIELLLSYSERFYNRQFITRKITNHKILGELEEILNDYFNSDSIKKGLPTVQYIARQLNVSPNYLSVLLKVITGQNTKQHIHDKLIEKAKEKLSTTDLSVSEIAYRLGFEHSQSFNRLFKSKTNISPLEFRRSFNN